MATINGAVSHWFSELPQPRPALPGDRDADVSHRGAGYTGLWTAYYLKQADPSLRIVVLEARFAGFGASGRNGGWLSGLAPGHRGLLAKTYGRDKVVAWQRTLNAAVDEVIDVANRENIEADIVRAATSTSPATPHRPAGCARRSTRTGNGEPTTSSCCRRPRRPNASGSITSCSARSTALRRVQPAKLARGLADVVERLGVTIYEQTTVTDISPGRAETTLGVVRAPIVLRATEGFTARMRAAPALAADEQRHDRDRTDLRGPVAEHRLGRPRDHG